MQVCVLVAGDFVAEVVKTGRALTITFAPSEDVKVDGKKPNQVFEPGTEPTGMENPFGFEPD